jgi:hypothetical protein
MCASPVNHIYIVVIEQEKREIHVLKEKWHTIMKILFFFYMDMGVNEHGKLSNFTLTHKGTPIWLMFYILQS